MLVLPLIALLLLAGSASGLTLPQAISSNMVLQRAPASARLWGLASAGSRVDVVLDSTRYNATASADGRWTLDMPPQPAGINRSINISGDGTSLALTNIAFGDVYICSGQSNMEFSVSDSFDAKTAIPDSINYPNLRLFSIEKKASLTPLNDTTNRWTDGAQWVVSQPKYVGGPSFEYFSATCYYFGREVYRQTNTQGAVVPIGLIDTCWGGTRIEAWTTQAGLDLCGPVDGVEAYYQSTADSPLTRASKRRDEAQAEEAETLSPHSLAAKRMSLLLGRGGAEEQVQADPNPQAPSVLYNGMIAPIADMRVKGATWYQGEANAGNATNYAASAQLHTTTACPPLPFSRMQTLCPLTVVTSLYAFVFVSAASQP